MRFIYLDIFPPGFGHDELDLVLSAKNYSIFGKDISGVVFPKSLFVSGVQSGQAGLVSALLVPYFKFINLSPLLVRVPFMLVNLISIFLIGLIVYKKQKNISLTYIVIFISLTNPWLYFFSRYPAEASFALLFVLLGVYILYYKNNFILSIIAFVLAFYSYYGAKPFIIFFVPALIISRHVSNIRSNLKNFIIYLIFFIILLAPFFYSGYFIKSSTFSLRLSESLFNDKYYLSSEVDNLRRTSIDSWMIPFFINKGTVLYDLIIKNFIGWVNSDFLFFSGDYSGAHRFSGHGLFYVADLVFILLGFVVLLKSENSDLKKIVFLLLLCSPLGSTFNKGGQSYLFRSIFLVIPLLIFISLGFNQFVYYFKNNRYRIVKYLIATVYFLFFIRFLFFYFLRFPIIQQENFFLSERILSEYLIRNDKETIVVTDSPDNVFNEYLFYSSEYSQLNRVDLSNNVIKYGGLIFTNECVDIKDKTVIFQQKYDCYKDGDYLIIQNQKDSGGIYRIFNDELCKNFTIDRYRRTHKISDYDFSKLDNSSFCNRWVFR